MLAILALPACGPTLTTLSAHKPPQASAGQASPDGSSETASLPETAKGSNEQDGPRYKVGEPYVVQGVTYVPRVDNNYDETGIASWYGGKFHGGETANGETYNMNAMTAAHKTLPLPSIVRVTNLENGRQVRVRVNDRGPFVKGRIIDLSRRAAKLLGMQDTGTARVRVQIDAEASRRVRRKLKRNGQGGQQIATGEASAPVSASTASPQSENQTAEGSGQDTELYIQAGAFQKRHNALELARELEAHGRVRIKETRVDGQRFYRVRVGPLSSVDAADRRLAQLQANGYPQARVVVATS